MQISFVGMYLYTQQHHVMGWGSAAEAEQSLREPGAKGQPKS